MTYPLTEEDIAMAELEAETQEAAPKPKKSTMTVKEAIEVVRQLDHQAANIEERNRLKEAQAVLAAQEVVRVKG